MKVRVKGGGNGVPQLGDVVIVSDRDKPKTPGIVCGFDAERRHLLVTLFDRHLSRLRVPAGAVQNPVKTPAAVEDGPEGPK